MKFTHMQINVAIKYVYVDNKAAYVFTVAMILSQKKNKQKNKKSENIICNYGNSNEMWIVIQICTVALHAQFCKMSLQSDQIMQ